MVAAVAPPSEEEIQRTVQSVKQTMDRISSDPGTLLVNEEGKRASLFLKKTGKRFYMLKYLGIPRFSIFGLFPILQ